MPAFAPNRPLIIASRRSRLAVVQAEWVAAQLRARHPKLAVEHLFVESEGDRFAGRLADAGGKGMFTSSVEALLLDGRADIAVHSMKDMPVSKAELTPGLAVIAVPVRETVGDVLVARAAGGAAVTGWRQLPVGARIGTASLRRQAQLLRLRPDLKVELLRGNVETRLRKATENDLKDGGVDATLLAAAGLQRLGIRAGVAVSLDDMLPAPGQGALAIQARIGDPRAFRACLGLNDSTAAACAHGERALVGGLGADCHSPVAALVEPVLMADRFAGYRVRARVLAADGSRCLEIDLQGKAKDLAKLVKRATAELLAQGAREIL